MVERILQAWYGQTWNTVVAMDCSAERASALRGQRLHWLFRWVQYSTGVRTSVCKWENSNKCFHKTAAARPCFAQWRAPSRGAPLRGARPSAFRRQTPWSIIRPTPPGPSGADCRSRPGSASLHAFSSTIRFLRNACGSTASRRDSRRRGRMPMLDYSNKTGRMGGSAKNCIARMARIRPPRASALPPRAAARPAPRQLPAARAAWYASTSFFVTSWGASS